MPDPVLVLSFLSAGAALIALALALRHTLLMEFHPPCPDRDREPAE